MSHVFHPNHDELHGFTVVVTTTGPLTCIGRWNHEENGQVLLLDAAIHNDGDNGQTRDEFIKRCALWGVRATHPNFLVSRDAITGVQRLGDVAATIRGW